MKLEVFTEILNRLQEKKKITLSLPLIASSGMNLDELCVSSSGALSTSLRVKML